MARGNAVVRIKVYGRRDTAVPFAASLLALLICLNVGLAFFRDFVWLAFIPWAAFTTYLAFDFWESRFMVVDRKSKSLSLGRKKLPLSDIKSIGRTHVRGYADLISLRRVRVKLSLRSGETLYFPLPLTPSIADRADRLVAELKKQGRIKGRRG